MKKVNALHLVLFQVTLIAQTKSFRSQVVFLVPRVARENIDIDVSLPILWFIFTSKFEIASTHLASAIKRKEMGLPNLKLVDFVLSYKSWSLR